MEQRQVVDPGLIKSAGLFSALLERELDYAAAHSGIIRLREGERLFSVGRRAEHFYILLEGSVRVFKAGDEGELARYAPGDTIGDFDFARRSEYEADAEASEDSALIIFPAPGFTLDSFIAEEPLIFSRILLNSIAMMTSRIKSTQKKLLENFSWVNELHRRAYEDPGTGLWRQAFLTDEINRILEAPMALIMLKPDRFKILVDSRGHETGDQAMVRIAKTLKIFARRIGRGWAVRFKSNETGLIINKCPRPLAERVVAELSKAVEGMEPFPAQQDMPAFSFTGTIAYSVWPEDGENWEALFDETYALLLNTWKNGGGGKICSCRKTA